MTDEINAAATPTPDPTVTAALPPVPQPGTCDEGYDWMEQLSPEWRVVSGNSAGQMVGEWPYVVVAHYSDRANGQYGVAVWESGTVKVDGYSSAADRNAAIDLYVMED